jgi:hypothetical protein
MNVCVSIPNKFIELGMKVISMLLSSMVLTHSLPCPHPGILPAGVGIFPQQLNTNEGEQVKNGDTHCMFRLFRALRSDTKLFQLLSDIFRRK